MSEKGFWGKARNTHLRKNVAISRARDSNPLVWVTNFYRGTVARGWNRDGVRAKVGDFALVFLTLALCQFLSCYFLQTRKQFRCTGWVADELFVLHFRVHGVFLHSIDLWALPFETPCTFFSIPKFLSQFYIGVCILVDTLAR